MKDRNVDVLLQNAGGVGLLSIQVEMAERTRSDEQVGALLFGFDDVIAAHRQRLVTIERQHWKSASFGCAAVFDRLGAQQRDQALEVAFTFGPFAQPKLFARPQNVATVKRRDLEARELALDRRGDAVDADVLEKHPEEVLDL